MLVAESIALKHLDRITDSTGLIQHAIYSIPRRESGCTKPRCYVAIKQPQR